MQTLAGVDDQSHKFCSCCGCNRMCAVVSHQLTFIVVATAKDVLQMHNKFAAASHLTCLPAARPGNLHPPGDWDWKKACTTLRQSPTR
eukprot:353394-Chlamydomonas_euryale.AAC.7